MFYREIAEKSPKISPRQERRTAKDGEHRGPLTGHRMTGNGCHDRDSQTALGKPWGAGRVRSYSHSVRLAPWFSRRLTTLRTGYRPAIERRTLSSFTMTYGLAREPLPGGGFGRVGAALARNAPFRGTTGFRQRREKRVYQNCRSVSRMVHASGSPCGLATTDSAFSTMSPPGHNRASMPAPNRKVSAALP